MKDRSLRFLLVMTVFVTVACSEPPYVYDAAAIDRNHADFGKTRTDRDAVRICYNQRGTTPREISSIASETCGEFGKVAVFDGHDYTICPLSHPVAAHYVCAAPASSTYDSIYRF